MFLTEKYSAILLALFPGSPEREMHNFNFAFRRSLGTEAKLSEPGIFFSRENLKGVTLKVGTGNGK